MSRTYKDDKKRPGGSGRRHYQLSARAVRRDSPDLRKLARAVIQLAMAEAEADAAADEQARHAKSGEAPASTEDQPNSDTEEADRG